MRDYNRWRRISFTSWLLLVLLVVQSLLSLPSAVHAAGVRLNLKSAVLSNLLGIPQDTDESNDKGSSWGATNASQKNAASRDRPAGSKKNEPVQKKDPDLLRLDLSGNIQCQLVGPTTATSQPLFVTEPYSSSQLLPRVTLSADYDFSKRWYGATRLLASVGCRRKTNPPGSAMTTSETDNDYNDVDAAELAPMSTADIETRNAGSIWSNLRVLPTGFHARAEQGLLLEEEGDVAGQIVIDWGDSEIADTIENNGEEFSSVTARIESTGKRGVAVSLPLHQRLKLQWKVSDNVQNGEFKSPLETMEQEETENAWWMPDISVDALGRMESKNQAWFQSPLGRTGVRFSCSRRLNWNAMGFGGDGMESQTLLQLQVQAVQQSQGSGGGRSSAVKRQSTTTAQLQTILERPLSSARLVVRQENAIGCLVPESLE